MRGLLGLVLLLLLATPLAVAQSTTGGIPSGEIATPDVAALATDASRDTDLTFVDIQRVWLDLSGDRAIVVIEVQQLDEVFLRNVQSWSGKIDLYDWNSKSRIIAEWGLEHDHEGAARFTYRTLEGWSPRETESAFKVSYGAPGYVAFALPRDAWNRDDVGYFRTIDVHTASSYKGALHQDSLVVQRENPFVPAPSAPFVVVGLLAGLGLAARLRRRPPANG